jgi:hypothetical protein
MKPLAKCVVWLLPFTLAGCYNLPFHKSAPPKPQSLAPYLHPSQPLEVVRVDLPIEESLLPGVPIYNLREEPQEVKPPVKHRRLSIKSPEEAVNATEAVANVTPSINAIGELSSGDSQNLRGQTEESISSAERRLAGFNRGLNDSEQKIADHIRAFLKQARTALASGDVEGAHTLAVKAQILLDELSK